MAVSPETEIAAAYAAGRTAAAIAPVQSFNPFDGSTLLSSQQMRAWNQGYTDQTKDLNQQGSQVLVFRQPILAVSIVLTAAQVNALQTVFPVLVTGQAGVAYIPQNLTILKAAGTAYTVGAGQIAIGNPAFYYGITMVGLLDQAGTAQKYRSLASITGGGDPIAAYAGGSLVALTTGTISGGTGSVTLTCTYQPVPTF